LFHTPIITKAVSKKQIYRIERRSALTIGLRTLETREKFARMAIME
jgi:ABC-type hemin transport system substrate-binding protein